MDYKLITNDHSLILELNRPASEQLNIEVYDISGRVIENKFIEKGSNSCKINRPH